ncbi:MAG TPA: AAA family ATPase [Chitinophagales bacterium]|nr:AAA family ATPase [Chitinophagales bacterium]HMW94773.1 AAA family ATPase [Chitinophagales bacterium]HMY42691.1 AAA family ATPase [Chitinophagales bacterium]HMZ94269.1 AAA family ATPase [Chitinophagales bacterium]HNB39244.1 AAA family ATPase [Chitinophagales bacterium]
MSRIRIRDFGPIKEGNQSDDGWIDIKKVTIFIGNQGAGKSTVAKLISTFTWIEKALVRGDYNKKWFERKNKLKNQYLNYHRLENYFKINGVDKTVIEYEGDAFSIVYENGSLTINEVENKEYPLPQIMYVPAERNFITYVKTPKELKLSSESLKEFLTEFDNAKNEMKGLEKLPINNLGVDYDKLNDTLNLKGENYKVKLTEASSGFQSLVPLYLVSSYLANSVKNQSETNKEMMSSDEMQRFKKGVEEIWNNNNLTDEQKRVALSVLSAKFNKTAFINIVEEPEQNLFPTSQWQMLQSLLKCNSMNKGNKLIVTTHSPYIINYLSVAIQGEYLENKIKKSSKKDVLLSKLYNLIPKESLISANNVVVYQLSEKDGSITKLETIDGIPSDKNYLNETLAEGNLLFDSLLEIEQEL